MRLNKINILFAALTCVGMLSCTTTEFEQNLADQPPSSELNAVGDENAARETADDSNVGGNQFAGADPENQTPFEEVEPADSTLPPDDELTEPELGGEALNSVGFRVSQFGIMSPPLCVMNEDDSSCHNVDMMVNDTFDAMLNDIEAPMDLLGIFDNSSLEKSSQISFGAADCFREEGEIISCAPVGPTDLSFLNISEDEDCIGGAEGMEKAISAPCFVTEGKDIQIFVQGMLVGLLDAQIMGTLEESNQGYDISGGFITGFVPEFMAQNWLLSTAGQEENADKVSFDQLFHRTACHPNEDGEMGWNLVLGFSGSAVVIDSL